MAAEISVIEVKSRPLAVARVTTVLSKWPDEFMHTLNKVYAAVNAGLVRQNGQNVMIYHPRQDGSVDIECGVETEGRFEPAGEVVYSETPSGRAVTMTHVGPYSALRSSFQAMDAWSRQNGYRLSGPCWEIYGDWEEDPMKLRTDIFLLLQA